MFLAFLRGRMLHLRSGSLYLRRRSLHLLNRMLYLRRGTLHLRSRACFRTGRCWMCLGGRPCLLDRSGPCLHSLDGPLWLVWPYLLWGDRPGDLPYGRDCLRLQVLHSKRPGHGHRLRLAAVH
jgi:hypothetical protein